MSWLLRDDDVLAALEDRRRGWAADLHGALLFRGPALVHTMATAASLDLAWCDEIPGNGADPCFEVRRISCLPPHRVARPRLGRGAVVVARRGAFERWKLEIGDRLEIRQV
jgi:hypothetical protein